MRSHPSPQKSASRARAVLLVLSALVLSLFSTGASCVREIPPGASAEEIFEIIDADLQKYEKGGWVETRGARSLEQIRRDFSRLRLTYPFSRWAVEAELRTADSYYVQDRYEEAEAVYRQFIRNRPSHPKIAYALLRQARCYEKQAPLTTMSTLLFEDEIAVDRDQSSTLGAYQLAQEVMQRFPGSEEAEQARELASRMATILSHHEMEIGVFYQRQEKYEAAAGRFETARTRFPDSRRYGEATWRLGRCLEALDRLDQARIAYQSVLSLSSDRFPKEPGLDTFERSLAYFTDPELVKETTGEGFWKRRAKRRLDKLGANAQDSSAPSEATEEQAAPEPQEEPEATGDTP